MRRGILIHVAKGYWFENGGWYIIKYKRKSVGNQCILGTKKTSTGAKVTKIPIPVLDPSVPSFDQGILNQWHQSWLVVWHMNFIFPYIGNNHPNWLIFFRVETTNQRGYYGISPVLGFDTGDQPLTPMHGMFPEKKKQTTKPWKPRHDFHIAEKMVSCIIFWLVVWNILYCFPYIGTNHPIWLSYFSRWLKPPTSISYPIIIFPLHVTLDLMQPLFSWYSHWASSHIFLMNVNNLRS